MNTRTFVSTVLIAGLFLLATPPSVWAICKNTAINPVTDVCWQCMFPVKIGGTVSFGGGGNAGDVPPGSGTETAGCACLGPPPVTGLTVAFWEHARLVETVKDAYCFTSLGTSLQGDSLSGLLSGAQRSHTGADGNEFASVQAHWYIFPVWQMLELFMDFPCVETLDYDVSMTEVDPMWNDDALGFILNPEALLFGNPVTQLACMADSVMLAATGKPIDSLFWCLGSWGSAYPFTGSTTESNPLVYNAQLGARMIAKLSREFLIRDTALDKCSKSGVMAPIINKSHYRMQIAKPRKGTECVPIGQTPLLWGSGKNPALGTGSEAPDNFLWVVTRARVCCVGYSWDE